MMRRVARLLDDGVPHGLKSGGGSRRYANLIVDVLDVVIGGLRRDVELVGDLLRREPPRREGHDIDFASGESGRILRAAGRGVFRFSVTGSPEHAL